MWKIILTLFSILLIIYLNRSYARFYDLIGKGHFSVPFVSSSLEITPPTNNEKSPIIYVALGDSLTAGIGSEDYHKTYPYIVAEKLGKKKNQPVRLIDIATPGAKTTDLFPKLDQVKKINPDYITLLIGINDMHEFKSTQTFQSDYEHILSELRQTHAKITLITIPYLGQSSSALPPYNFLFDYQTKQLNSVITYLAKKYNVHLIDLYSDTKKLFENDSSLYSRDLFHPSEKGYIVWGQFINAD